MLTLTRQHDNTNPVTKEPLAPSDLITLHYSRKTSGEIHDPISFKPFSEHSHVVAIATTGNVFLAESIKGGRDLVADVKFKKYVAAKWHRCSLYSYPHRDDVITLQNPHGMPPMSVSASKTAEKVVPEKEKTKAVVNGSASTQTAAKPKNVPCKLVYV